MSKKEIIVNKIETICIVEDGYSIDKTIPSSCNFEIVVSHSDFKRAEDERNPDVILKGNRDTDKRERIIKEGFRINIEETIMRVDVDYNEIGIKEVMRYQ